jgi:hypothetical protein
MKSTWCTFRDLFRIHVKGLASKGHRKDAYKSPISSHDESLANTGAEWKKRLISF